MPPRLVSLGAFVLTLSFLNACQHPHGVCTGCEGGQVCNLQNECEELGTEGADLRFTGSVVARAVDWGAERYDTAERIGRGDPHPPIGGDEQGTLSLAFDVPQGELVQATLTLFFPDLPRPLSGSRELRIAPIAGFDGETLSGRSPSRRNGADHSARVLRFRPGAPIYFDLTEALVGHEGQRVYFRVESPVDGSGWPIASPANNDPRLHPSMNFRVQ